MPNIVMPVRANLLLQMLLEMEIYVTFLWAITYLVLIMCCQFPRHLLTALGAYVLAIVIEGLRIYCGFVLNLYPSLSQAKWLFIAILGLSLPLLAALWYVRWALQTGSTWNNIIWNMIVIFVGLEIIVLCILWPKTLIKSHDWPKMETLLLGRQQRQRQR